MGADGSARGQSPEAWNTSAHAFDALPGVGRLELEYLEDFPTGFHGALDPLVGQLGPLKKRLPKS